MQCRDLSVAKSVANTGALDLMAVGIIVRVYLKFQQKTSTKTKVFELSKFDVGSEKKEVV
ncbi:MAG: putative transposase [Pseudohongiellaceae bacterium]|jgi:putative transposase